VGEGVGVLSRALLYPVRQSLNPVNIVATHIASILAKPSKLLLSEKCLKKGLRRVYDIPSWSCIVPKGTTL
jgi:hypothetical protein